VIVFSIRAKVAPELCSELLSFVTSILKDVRLLDGCLACHCYQSVEDDCSFYFVEQWSENKHLESHIHSDLYSAISGAFKVLAVVANVELTYTDPDQDRVHFSNEGVN
jgi:quinol monooxygenase YgiN